MLPGNTVYVDNTKIVGAFQAEGHPKVAEVEAAFLRQHIWYPEHNAVLHFRWSYILENIPEMRSRHLYDDLTDIYESVATGGSCSRLFAAYDMAILQHRFWDLLFKNGMILVHAHGWQQCASQAWQRRLLERLENQKPWRRNQFGKVKRPVAKKPPPVGRWYH
jgi:hypothetical protein